MFGFGKKKNDSPTKPARSKVSDGDKEKNKAETRAQLNLFGVGDDTNVDVGDDDLEDELLALLGEDGGKPKRSKPPPRPPRPAVNKPQQAAVVDFSASNYDVDLDSEGDDDDIDDADLEAELGELTGQSGPPQKSVQETTVVPPASTIGIDCGESMKNTLQERLVMYQKAKAKSDASGETAKSRRFIRGIKTLEDLLKNANLGKVVDEADIPPVVALGDTKQKENVSTLTTQIEDIPTFEPIPQIPHTNLPTVPASKTEPELIASSEPTPSTLIEQPIIVDPLVDARLKDYKKMAVILKRSGDSQGGLQYLKLAKQLEVASRSGTPVDLSAFPSIPDPTQSNIEEPIHSTQKEMLVPNVPSQPPETQPENTESVGLPNELFTGPEAPKTILEALQQRLEKYKSEVDKATSENNSSKARRMGRIVKQYEEAISLYKKGKPVQYEDLPTPPGFAPIPVPGATVAEANNANSEIPSASPSSSSLHPSQPSQPTASPKVTRPSEPSTAGGVDVSPIKVPKPSGATPPGSSGSVTRGGKPGVKLTLQEKQLHEILRRQQMFKDAALNAKKLGDINQAREFLRTAKGFDQLIEASRGGLPVDMNTLPSAPEAVAALEAEDFELISGDDCIEVTGNISEVFSKLEEDLKNQLKVCMRTRDHYKSIGDIASANRFEKMALESKRDLDTLRIAAKQGGSIPKYHYETRIFSITECNTDLTEDEIEVNVLQGINYKVANPADVDTFVKVELPYPSAEEAQVHKTAVIKDTNNPTYNATFKMSINRNARNFQRFIHAKGIKLEVWSKGGFLRSSTLIGVATAKLLGLETKCNVHDAFEILDGRKSVGKLEVKIKIRDPVLMKQITQKKEKWLSIDRL